MIREPEGPGVESKEGLGLGVARTVVCRFLLRPEVAGPMVTELGGPGAADIAFTRLGDASTGFLQNTCGPLPNTVYL